MGVHFPAIVAAFVLYAETDLIALVERRIEANVVEFLTLAFATALRLFIVSVLILFPASAAPGRGLEAAIPGIVREFRHPRDAAPRPVDPDLERVDLVGRLQVEFQPIVYFFPRGEFQFHAQQHQPEFEVEGLVPSDIESRQEKGQNGNHNDEARDDAVRLRVQQDRLFDSLVYPADVYDQQCP